MQLIDPNTIFLFTVAIMAIIICLYCCKSSESSGQASAIMKNQDIMLKSINGDLVTITRTIDRMEKDVDYLKGKANGIRDDVDMIRRYFAEMKETVNKIDEYIDNQSKQK